MILLKCNRICVMMIRRILINISNKKRVLINIILNYIYMALQVFEIMRWHCRLGHPKFKYLKLLVLFGVAMKKSAI